MSKRLPVPPELEILIEKREQEKDRRAQKRRAESGDAKSEPTAPKGQGGADRRTSKDRRQKPRRRR